MNKTGFGFLRLPRTDGEQIDYALLFSMVDRFLELGGSYFDTAYTYLGGLSEEALRKALVERYPRDRFRIADKLPGFAAKSPEDSRRFLEESLRRCGVDYFDVYLLHGLNAENYEIALRYGQFDFLRQLKRSGKARKIGFSFHDTAQLLDRILTEQPELDYVQLQINYLDWDSISIQSRLCYETARRHGIQVLVMEPVKGGALAGLPGEAELLLKQSRPQDSPARWAIRFASEPDAVEIVLSGMNSMAQMEDNMRPQEPLTPEEHALLQRTAQLIRANTAIECTGCSYCTPGCPVGMPIPRYFTLFNEYRRNPSELWKTQTVYASVCSAAVPASACVRCGRCESSCPQKLPIISWLQKVDESLSEETS